ncbi:hypothetical protein IB211_03225 [Intestinimonas butyriciproducens]|uniref:Uncharacterized protein n=1 Tax=Intestinimonas butyriciproducens TaxID=1297617 RepID=A0A0S2W8J1_9FIRM|nr:hypothetical protein IB211_03225 [Intestinimonas butyriciproducens]
MIYPDALQPEHASLRSPRLHQLAEPLSCALSLLSPALSRRGAAFALRMERELFLRRP